MYDFIWITAAIPGRIAFRFKIWYEDEAAKEKIRGGALVVANHIAISDPMMLLFAIPYRRIRFVCLKQFFEYPVSAWFFRAFHCIPVDRDNFSMETLRCIVGRLKDDKVVAMFPEGHIVTETSELDGFKTGMVLMSAMSGKPIRPVYIIPTKKWWHRRHIVIGRPYDVAGAYGSMPSLRHMEQVAADLREQEIRLSQIPYERRKNK